MTPLSVETTVVVVIATCHYLLVRFEGPVLLDVRVTKILHLLQHCCHESGPQLPCICSHPISMLISEVLSNSRVIVKGRKSFKKSTATIHVPVQCMGL